MSLRKEVSLRSTTGTWIGHAALTALVGILFAILSSWEGAYALGTVATAVIFVMREGWNKDVHIATGDYDDIQNEQRVTNRVDMVGDMIGPICVAVGAVLQFITNIL